MLVAGFRLQQPRAYPLRSLAQQTRRLGNSSARHYDRTRAPGPSRERAVQGVSLEHLDPLKLDSEDLMRDLRQCGFVPLPVRMGTDANFKAGIGGEPHGRLLMSRHHGAAPIGEDGGPQGPLLEEDRESHPDQAPVGLASSLPLANGG